MIFVDEGSVQAVAAVARLLIPPAERKHTWEWITDNGTRASLHVADKDIFDLPPSRVACIAHGSPRAVRAVTRLLREA